MLQGYSVAMCRLLYQYRGQAAFKAMMKHLGCDCGPNRLPIKALNSQEQKSLRSELDQLGFFEWGRKKYDPQKVIQRV